MRNTDTTLESKMDSLPQDTINQIAMFSQYPVRKILTSDSYSRYQPEFEVLESADFNIVLEEDPHLIRSGNIALIVDDILVDSLPDIRPLVVVSRCLNNFMSSMLENMERIRTIFQDKMSLNTTAIILSLGGSFGGPVGMFAATDDLLLLPSKCLDQHQGIMLISSFPVTQPLLIPFLRAMKLMYFSVMLLFNSREQDERDIVKKIIDEVPTLKFVDYPTILKQDNPKYHNLFISSRSGASDYVLNYQGTKIEYTPTKLFGQRSIFVDYWIDGNMDKIPNGTCIPVLRYDNRITQNMVQMLQERNINITQIEFTKDQDPEHLFPICKIVVIPKSYTVRGCYPQVKTVVYYSIADQEATCQSFPNARYVVI